jgi:hypothetical protein
LEGPAGSGGNVEAGSGGGRDFAVPVGHARGMTCLNGHGRARLPQGLDRVSALGRGVLASRAVGAMRLETLGLPCYACIPRSMEVTQGRSMASAVNEGVAALGGDAHVLLRHACKAAARVSAKVDRGHLDDSAGPVTLMNLHNLMNPDDVCCLICLDRGLEALQPKFAINAGRL